MLELKQCKRPLQASDADMSGSTFNDVNLAGASFDDVNLQGVTISSR